MRPDALHKISKIACSSPSVGDSAQANAMRSISVMHTDAAYTTMSIACSSPSPTTKVGIYSSVCYDSRAQHKFRMSSSIKATNLLPVRQLPELASHCLDNGQQDACTKVALVAAFDRLTCSCVKGSQRSKASSYLQEEIAHHLSGQGRTCWS